MHAQKIIKTILNTFTIWFTMRISPDEALKNFTELMKEQWISLSESDTRSKIIDPIFTKCLNWEETDFSREEHSDTGFVDYVFKIGKKNVFVIEAKREGVSFSLNYQSLLASREGSKLVES